ncbi:multicopper oxidase family protein [Sandaracinus amylolyticus]|uniref:multicopper oxidase family protein n=1 Tax=Sandaracinus amylolyticus TaxID=927083 RepID=UPI001F30AFF0|nr:multicopper oxidase family protein [Sandaracinus amylolyticus]UJR86596.1 Hypothetical protein I5071_86970 [Sandaracinus amylolyticus]
MGLALLALSCAPQGDDLAQPMGWDEEVRLETPTDLDPDPRVIEIEMVARETELAIVEAGATRMWSYGGTVPGPRIDARVGDRLIVHFRNELPEPTTIHWHGVRVPNEMDGAPDHPNPPIAPGETFDYDFVLPDEGLYWFHPHHRSAAQVAAGLYGTIVVRADDEPEMDELVLVLSDVATDDDDDGQLLGPDVGGSLATLFGREGNHVLTNGRERPTIRARNGVPLRLRMVNAAISRYFQLAIEGHRFTVIGGDAGISPSGPRESARPVIMPGQRVDAIVVPRGRDGETLTMRWVPYDRGYGSTEFRDEVDVLAIELVGAPEDVAIPDIPARQVEALSTAGATRFDVDLTQRTVDGQLVMGFDGVPHWDATPVAAHVGETQVWTFRNTMDWSHPIHLHGFFFQALDAHGNVLPEWIDTIDVPVDGEASFVVRYDERPGMWMVHCHILDHADAGMMGMIDVSDGSHDHVH